MTTVLELKNISKIFRQGEETLALWQNLNFCLKQGEVVALVGASGAGKSTLLQVAGLLEKPTEGDVIIAGESSCNMNDDARTQHRSKTLGFVYQSHLLLPEFSALENVMMPQIIAGTSMREARTKALELLTQLGLEKRASHRPKALSGGEQQRVAIARALANKPVVLLADEPTGNLDNQTADKVFTQLMTRVRETGLSALIATHNMELAQQMDRVVILKDGVLAA